MDFLSIIAARRDGLEHTEADLRFLAQGAADGSIPDYQLAAWLMAAVLHPLNPRETAWLTLAMADSGERLDLSSLPKPWVDKHSTGGVGDKTTLVLLPLLASCGLTMVKMSGRGLGITGGTVDKLESVPGFRMDLSPEEMVAQAGRIGIAITGQTPRLAPADKALYALRDATATVRSIPLIVSSILSKKIAGGAETIVIDLKCGSGAFMKTLEEAQELRAAMLATAEEAGIGLRVAITDMDQPLGRAIGNRLEVLEAMRVLKGEAYGRFRDLCVELAGLTLLASGKADSQHAGETLARRALDQGHALQKAKEWFAAQGAGPAIWDSPWGEDAPIMIDVVHEGAPGWAKRVDAQRLGQAALDLGAGRKTKTDAIDVRVGLEMQVEVGDRLEVGQPLARVHAATEEAARAAEGAVHAAVVVSGEPVLPVPVVLQ